MPELESFVSESTSPSDNRSATRAPHHRWWMVVSALLLISLTIAAITLWSPEPCSRPNCAVQRFSVSLEIDALGLVSPIGFEVVENGETHSLQSILRSGGVNVSLNLDQVGLPYDPSSGALDRADLYQLVTAWRNKGETRRLDATLYALFTAGLISDKGTALFGIMFDTAGREGFAVAPRTTERFFGAREPQSIATLQLRTFVHELLHAFNRHHTDAVTMQDGRLTLEAPTRCISDTQQREWSLRERPLMALSPDTIRFFQTAAAQDILPGSGHSPFRNQRVSPTECDDARMRASPPDHSFWENLALRWHELFAIKTASAAQMSAAPDEPLVQLRLQAQVAAYPLGYPIALRVQVRNESEESIPLIERLNPAYGMLSIESRREEESEWRVLQPTTWFEPSSNEEAMLEPAASFEETIAIYFSEDGWTFPQPGEYTVRARLKTSDEIPEAISPPVSIRVEAPRTEDDRAALQPLLNESGELDVEMGRLLSFGGRIGRAEDLQPLERVTKQYGHTAIGGALHLTLLSQRLRRPIDPTTGLRPAPDFADARELLDDTCTDSGVAALTTDLLAQRPEALPDALRRRIESEAFAWDGRGAGSSGGVMLTYSDPSLNAWGPSIHFCFNEADVRGQLRSDTASLARRLRREQPTRIVLVGHGDQLGTCRYNDGLALRRAQAVQRALVAAGIQQNLITAVSMGERRPLDFAASETAHSANRRVEILIDRRDDSSEQSDPQQLLPECPMRR